MVSLLQTPVKTLLSMEISLRMNAEMTIASSVDPNLLRDGFQTQKSKLDTEKYTMTVLAMREFSNWLQTTIHA